MAANATVAALRAVAVFAILDGVGWSPDRVTSDRTPHCRVLFHGLYQ